ncbi:MAG: ribosomal L7Ae/L30e/S12e/Gadd45 family protein [Clostridia bacterium]|nr:ribosomal L7Ae/L30e/S12e/Gadd45 family protein [Clostridia bacterium]
MSAVFGLLGLACRAGQATLGAEVALAEIKSGKAALALIDEGASEGTKKKLLDACAFRDVPAFFLPEGEISRACGRDGRMAASVKKGSLSKRMEELLKQAKEAPDPAEN